MSERLLNLQEVGYRSTGRHVGSGRKQMSNQPRVVKVLAALLVSMTVGAVVLMALGNNPPSAGPFCLSAYYRLDSVLGRLAAAQGLRNAGDLGCHFVLCNGTGASDGEIQTTESWQRQRSVQSASTGQGHERTIRICLIGNGVSALTTDYQLKRLEILLEALCRRFSISPDAVYLPRDCR